MANEDDAKRIVRETDHAANGETRNSARGQPATGVITPVEPAREVKNR